MTTPREAPLFSSFETWPDGIFYAPIFLYWIWLILRFRGALIMLTDPLMPLGGFTADLKSDWFKMFGPKGMRHTAPFVVTDDAHAEEAMKAAGLSYPIVAKPDLGKNGTGVRIIEDARALTEYFTELAPGTAVVLQTYIPYEGEAGVFYIRYPHEAKGRIVSLTLKYFPKVSGNGSSTLRELIEADPRAKVIKHLYFARHGTRLDEIIPAGEQVRLVSVGNHCKGAIFKDGKAHITPALEEAFEEIAREMPEFYFGRFDVRFGSLETFKEAKDFFILEANGPGSEMTHIWDAEMTLGEAYRTLFGQYRTAWEIGAENRARGYKLPSLRALIQSYFRERELLKSYTWKE